jgi:glutamate 5-kinase
MARIVVKLGSGVVARDDGALRPDVLAGVCEVVAERHAAGDEVVVVTSGAIARGLEVMGLGGRPTAIEDLQAASAVGQGKLYRVYDELLRDRGLTSAQVLLTFHDVSARAQYLNARQTLARLLAWRVVPVVNENDTTATDEISFGDNDFLAAQIAVLVAADLLVVLTAVDGLYTADPRRDPAARRIDVVRGPQDLEGLEVGRTTTALGSGGMRSKVVAAEMATAAGIPAVICDGLDPGALRRVLGGGRAGTRFEAQAARHSSFKLWLRYAKPALGEVLVDAGAARALRDGGTSLLPVGVVDVRGGFDAGDAVEVRAGDALVGKGISNYSAAELRRVKGLKSADVRAVLPRATEEAVHRDYFVLT